MNSFAELGLSELVLRALESQGHQKPTPIQAKVIPQMLAGRDIVGIAQTGTGKTGAFVLPLLQRLAGRNQGLKGIIANQGTPKQFDALILAPTRELASQIARAIEIFGKNLRPNVTLVVGGANPAPQIKGLARGPDIVVATPGRLLDHVRARKAILSKTKIVILDEADQMLDLGFMPAIRDIMRGVGADRQTLLLSATMPKPIRALAADFMKDPVEIAVAAVSRPVEKIDQRVILVEQSAKSDLLVDLLASKDVERAIVFTRTKRGTDKVERMLNTAGLRSVGIHGDKTQGQRNRALEQFKGGKQKILVATDVAARGLDVEGISHVVNFDMPTMPEAYVHRIGRTGRAGRSGIAISLCDRSEKKFLKAIERLTRMPLSVASR